MALDILEGDIFTYHIEDDIYGIARVLKVEARSGSDVIHTEVYDAILGAGPGGLTSEGDWVERTHDLPDIDSLAVAIDHLALVQSALEESDPLVVDYREVTSADLVGHRVFIEAMRERLVQEGSLRKRNEEEPEEVEEVDEKSQDHDHDGDQEATDDDVDEEIPESVEVVVRPWHLQAFGVPMSRLVHDWTDILSGMGVREGGLVAWLAARWSADNLEEIDPLVEALLGGDFGAGHELMAYGDGAVAALAPHLTRELDAQQVEDVLNILADIGTDKAYDEVVGFLLRHIDKRPATPVTIAAMRAFCYAVTVTGGIPGPLQTHLDLLDRIAEPELVDDVRNARYAAANAGAAGEGPEINVPTSRPFGTLGG